MEEAPRGGEGQQRKDGKYETHRLRKTSTLLRTKRVSQKVSSSGYSQGTPGEAMGSTSFAYTEIQSYSVTRLYTVKDGKHDLLATYYHHDNLPTHSELCRYLWGCVVVTCKWPMIFKCNHCGAWSNFLVHCWKVKQ